MCPPRSTMCLLFLCYVAASILNMNCCVQCEPIAGAPLCHNSHQFPHVSWINLNYPRATPHFTLGGQRVIYSFNELYPLDNNQPCSFAEINLSHLIDWLIDLGPYYTILVEPRPLVNPGPQAPSHAPSPMSHNTITCITHVKHVTCITCHTTRHQTRCDCHNCLTAHRTPRLFVSVVSNPTILPTP